MGVAAFVLVAALDVVVAGALLTLFEPVHRSLAAMAAWFGIAYAATLLAASAPASAGPSPRSGTAASSR